MNYMEEAYKEGVKAFRKKEIPIGAIIVRNGKIISKAHNTREHSQQAINHAEILAIQKACKKLKTWRLNDCEMYVTLEPCPMCAGAILNSRLKSVHIACLDDKSGAVVSKYSLLDDGVLNHKCNIVIGEDEEKCKNLIKDFFKSLRK